MFFVWSVFFKVFLWVCMRVNVCIWVWWGSLWAAEPFWNFLEFPFLITFEISAYPHPVCTLFMHSYAWSKAEWAPVSFFRRPSLKVRLPNMVETFFRHTRTTKKGLLRKELSCRLVCVLFCSIPSVLFVFMAGCVLLWTAFPDIQHP